MKAQLKSMGLASTGRASSRPATPSYYRHQQKLFLDFLEAGLVTRKKSKVNWDPVDMTVLANEQVIDGRGWRSGAVVEQRELTQWFFKISDFAEELLSALDGLDGWPDKVRLMQRNWIGKSEGLRLLFEVVPQRQDRCDLDRGLHDAARHDLRRASSRSRPTIRWPTELAAKDAALSDFIAECHRHGTATETLEKAEKIGYRHRPPGEAPGARGRDAAGLRRQLRADGLRHRRHLRLPGARPARPRLRPQVRPAGDPGRRARRRPIPQTFAVGDEAYARPRHDLANSGFLDGLSIEDAKKRIAEHFAARTVDGRPQGIVETNYRLRDWGVSRQRYWGCPIPVIHCESLRHRAGAREADLPVELPDDVDLRQARQSARPPSDLEARRLPAVRRRGPARDRHDGHLRRLVLVFRALHRAARRQRRPMPERRQRLAAGRPVYRRRRARDPAPALLALLRPRDDRRPATSTSTSRSAACSPRAW